MNKDDEVVLNNCEHDFVFMETVKHEWHSRDEHYRTFYGFSKADRFYCKKCLKTEIRKMEYVSDSARAPIWY